MARSTTCKSATSRRRRCGGPSYRLVVDNDGASLQTWGIVQNLSGEDWTNVSLSLVAEAPLAFHAELATPVIPMRPTVTDGGDVIAVIPRTETTLAEDDAGPTTARFRRRARAVRGDEAGPPEATRNRGPHAAVRPTPRT